MLRAATTAAREALARTPDQLERLRRAGVVDAGGRALTVVLDTTERVLTGRRPPAARRSGHVIPVPVPDNDLSPDGPAYEVMYLLDADDDQVPALRTALAPLGDSLVVVGGDRLWNVHVHVDDVGAAIEAGIAAGRPYRIVVTHFAEQVAAAAATHAPRGRVVLATAAGPGLAALFTQAGARVVVPERGPALLDGRPARGGARQRRRRGRGAAQRPRWWSTAAEAAARQARADGVRVAVIPTRAQVAGAGGAGRARARPRLRRRRRAHDRRGGAHPARRRHGGQRAGR